MVKLSDCKFRNRNSQVLLSVCFFILFHTKFGIGFTDVDAALTYLCCFCWYHFAMLSNDMCNTFQDYCQLFT